MVRTLIKIVSVVWLLGASFLSQAQDINGNNNMGFSSTTLVNSNVPLDSSIFINTYLVNYGTTNETFLTQDSFIVFNLNVTNSNHNIPNVSSYPPPYITFGNIFPYPLHEPVNLAPGDSIPLSIIINTSPFLFKAGPNGLVIWPSVQLFGPGFDTIMQPPQFDTILPPHVIYEQVNITGNTTGINEPATGTTHSWVNNQTLYIINTGNAEQVSELRIFDLTGKEIYKTLKSWPYQIPTSGWSSGIYLADLRLSDGEKIILKLYNQ